MRQRDLIAAATLAAERLASVKDWFTGKPAIVYAPGPSLPELAKLCPQGVPSIAVKRAIEIIPWADILYTSDRTWWSIWGHQDFAGTKVCLQDVPGRDDVISLAISGHSGYDRRLGWSKQGGNSGCDAIHLVAQLGASAIGLVGFDMQRDATGQAHFYGDNQPPQHQPSNYLSLLSSFKALAREMPYSIAVTNLTPGSALPFFPKATIEVWQARVLPPARVAASGD